jgi:hypothetical protein
VLIPLSVPETRRVVLAMNEPAERRTFRLGWSHWRRAHQAVAARCHAAHHTRTHGGGAANLPVTLVLPIAGALTEAEWERIQPLLPPQQPRTGRRRHDHRPILAGILSVVRGGGSWREIPAAWGKWETAYRRYRPWCDTGLWPRILAVLAESEREVSL